MKSLKEEALLEIGLSKNESKVYLSLLKLGLTSVGKISEASGIHRTNVYDTLNRLMDKGLVSFVVKNDAKYFEANHPNHLLNILERKQDKVQTILPQLILDKNLAENISEAKIFTGVKAVRNILDGFLEKGVERCTYGVPKNASKILGPFIVHYHNRRIEKKLELRHIYNYDAKERRHFLNKKDLTQVRYLPKEYDSPVATCICGNEVDLILWQDEPLVIQIVNEKIAKAYQNYFELLWKISKND